MKKFLTLLLLPVMLLAQKAVTKSGSTSGATQNAITEDLKFNTPRVLSGTGTFDFSAGTLLLASSQVNWASVNKTGSSLADIPSRLFADLQSKPTTLAGYGITDASTTSVINSWFADPSTNGAFSPSAWRSDLSLGALALLNTAGTAQLDNDAVTFAKIQNIATDRLLGRDTALTGDPEEITVGGGLEFTGTGGIQRSALTGAITASAGSSSTSLGSFTLSAFNTALSDADVATGGGTATGTNTGDQTITLTGDVTGSGTGSFAATLATVNASPGTFGSATQTVTATVDAKGRITALSALTATPAVTSVTGMGTGVQAALQANVGSVGAPVLFGGALGTPSSGTLTNATGLPIVAGTTGTLTAARGGTGLTALSANVVSLLGATDYAAIKTQLSLNNVDNTSDVNKPISTAAQAALDLKAPLASPTFTGTPLAPTAAPGTDTTQIATTQFVRAAVDAATQALDIKASVRAIATSNITLSGAQTIDGVSVIAGDRVLVAGQTTASQNGIYVAASGAWTRAADADTSADVTSGLFTFVEEGSNDNKNKGFVLVTPEPIILGTTALSFSKFSGAGQITAGTGLTKTGDTLSTANIPNASLANSSVTIGNAGAIALGGSASLDSITGLSSNGLVKRTAANTYAAAVSGTDYVAPSAYASANGLTMATARLLGRTTAGTGPAEEISVGASLSFSAGTLQLPDTITAGSVGSSTAIPVLTYDAKGRLTAASTAAVVAPAGTLTGTTLAANVVTSSLTTVGALNSGSIASGFGSINIGSNPLTAGAGSFTTVTTTSDINIGGALTQLKFTDTTTEHFVTSNNGQNFLGINQSTGRVRIVAGNSQVATFDVGAVSVTGTLSATGSANFGTADTSTNVYIATINGGSGSGGGAYARFSRNGTPKIWIGTTQATIGPAEDSGAILAETALRLAINGSGTVANVTSSGVSVTGTLTASGGINNGSGGTNGYWDSTTIYGPASGSFRVRAGNASSDLRLGGTSSADHVVISSSGVFVGSASIAPSKTLHVYSGEAAVGATQVKLQSVVGGYGAGITFTSYLFSTTTEKEMARITADAEDSWTTTASSQDAGLRFYTTLDGTTAVQMRLLADGTLRAPGVYNQTTASAANVFVDSNGDLKRSTSSLRYKDLLGDYDRGLADVLKLRPVYFTDRGGGPRHAGFGAEDVHKAGLTEFVLYDKDGRPDALAYPHITALTVAALHDVDAQLKSLRARVRALETRQQ